MKCNKCKVNGKNVAIPVTDKRLVHKLYENHFELISKRQTLVEMWTKGIL